MTTTTHTPGPWVYTRQVGINHGIATVDDAKSTVGWRSVATAASAANARLIAAAPEMLAALEDAKLWLDSDDAGDKVVVAKINAAITRAGGK